MKKCTEFIELLSAYSDGELSEPERRSVEGHLCACGSCSALLGLYREISASVGESGVPTPESLLAGVMERITNDASVAGVMERTASDASVADVTERISNDASVPTAGSNQKRKALRPMLLRYTPVAACLAIILLSMPWIIDSLNRPSFYSAPPKSAQTQDIVAQLSDAGNGVAENSAPMPEFAEADMNIAGGAAPAQYTEEGEYGESHSYDRKGSDDDGADTISPFFSMDGQMDAPMDVTAHEPATSADRGPPSFGAQIPNDDAALQPTEAEDDIRIEVVPAPSGIISFLDSFSDAYVWIELTGKLPEILREYDPEPLDGRLSWEVYYMLPRTAAQELIGEISDSDNATIMYNYDDGRYAIVLYSAGG